MSVSARAHAQLSNMGRTKTHLKVPDGVNKEKTALFRYQLLLQPVVKVLRHFAPKMALLTSMVRKLQICHRRTFSPPFPVSMLSI